MCFVTPINHTNYIAEYKHFVFFTCTFLEQEHARKTRKAEEKGPRSRCKTTYYKNNIDDGGVVVRVEDLLPVGLLRHHREAEQPAKLQPVVQVRVA